MRFVPAQIKTSTVGERRTGIKETTKIKKLGQSNGDFRINRRAKVIQSNSWGSRAMFRQKQRSAICRT